MQLVSLTLSSVVPPSDPEIYILVLALLGQEGMQYFGAAPWLAVPVPTLHCFPSLSIVEELMVEVGMSDLLDLLLELGALNDIALLSVR